MRFAAPDMARVGTGKRDCCGRGPSCCVLPAGRPEGASGRQIRGGHGTARPETKEGPCTLGRNEKEYVYLVTIHDVFDVSNNDADRPLVVSTIALTLTVRVLHHHHHQVAGD